MRVLRLEGGSSSTRHVDRLGWAAGAAVESFGLRVGLRTSRGDALASASSRLPPGRLQAPGGRVDVLYSLVLGGPGPRSGMRRSHLLYCGGHRIARSLQLEEVLYALESHSRLLVASRSRRGVFLRAGAVAWLGSALVLAEGSRRGKTTLVTELVRAGAGYLSEGLAVIRGGRVVPYPKPPSVRATRRPGQEQRPVPVGLVALVAHEPGAPWRARALPPGQALLALLAHAVPARIRPRPVLAALERVVRSVPVVQVRRGDAREAARRLLVLVERTR